MGVAGQGHNRGDEAGKLRMGTHWQVWKWRLCRLFRLTQTDQDLDDEIRAHLAIETRQRIEAGDPPEVARLEALKDFGNVALVREVTREMWMFTSLERIWQDAR